MFTTSKLSNLYDISREDIEIYTSQFLIVDTFLLIPL